MRSHKLKNTWKIFLIQLPQKRNRMTCLITAMRWWKAYNILRGKKTPTQDDLRLKLMKRKKSIGLLKWLWFSSNNCKNSNNNKKEKEESEKGMLSWWLCPCLLQIMVQAHKIKRKVIEISTVQLTFVLIRRLCKVINSMRALSQNKREFKQVWAKNTQEHQLIRNPPKLETKLHKTLMIQMIKKVLSSQTNQKA